MYINYIALAIAAFLGWIAIDPFLVGMVDKLVHNSMGPTDTEDGNATPQKAVALAYEVAQHPRKEPTDSHSIKSNMYSTGIQYTCL